MIWFVFFMGAGCGGVVGMIAGKLLTEREMAEYAEDKYNDGYTAGCDAGYDDGYADAMHDNDIPDDIA